MAGADTATTIGEPTHEWHQCNASQHQLALKVGVMMIDPWSIVGDFGTAVAAVAASMAAVFTFKIMRAGQQQVQISQDQFRQSVEVERDAQLPILIPGDPIVSLDRAEQSGDGKVVQQSYDTYDPNKPFIRVEVKNVGPGIALNVKGVVLPAEPKTEAEKIPGRMHSNWFARPLVSGEVSKLDWTSGGPPLSGNTLVGDSQQQLYAPMTPSQVASFRGDTTWVARLTLTYSDIFGRKHATIFDLSVQRNWENVEYLGDIRKDLGDLQREALSQMMVYAAPERPIGSDHSFQQLQ